MKRSFAAVAAVLTLTTISLAVPEQVAAAPVVSPPLVTGLAGPLQIDVGATGQVYVGQAFAGVLTKVRPNGTTKDLVTAPGQEISGVASRGNDVVFTVTGGDPAHPTALLRQRLANGTVRTIADLYAFEKAHNPDAVNEYGFRHLSASCAAQVPAAFGGQPYTGRVDSHPYAVTNARDGGWYVADAAANDILKVEPNGTVTTVAVMHQQKLVLTAANAATLGLPACTVGKRYNFEPVPTDVELGRTRDNLYVTLLPGGPEDPSLGARGSIVHIFGCTGPCADNPDITGDQNPVAHGLFGATSLTMDPKGTIYVTELFANRVSVITDAGPVPLVSLSAPAGIDFANGRLYVSVGVFDNGSIVTVTP